MNREELLEITESLEEASHDLRSISGHATVQAIESFLSEIRGYIEEIESVITRKASS